MLRRPTVLRRNLHAVLLARLGLLLVLYALSRLAFYVYNRAYLGELSVGDLAVIFAGGLRFDLSAVLYVNFAYLLVNLVPLRSRHRAVYQRACDGLFLVTNGIALATNAVDLEYYRFTLKRTTSAVFHEFANEEHLGNLVAQLGLEHWAVTLAVLASVALVALAERVTRLAAVDVPPPSRRYYLQAVALFPVALALMVAGCRGGFFGVSHRPITNANAAAYVREPQHTAVVLNTPFSLIRTVDKEPLERRTDFSSDEELAQVYTPVHQATPGPEAKRSNVVLLILESFGANAVGHLNKHLEGGAYRGYTPFLDELSTRCRTFPHAFANGLHSIEALPSLVASVPSLKAQFVVSPYSNDRLVGLPALLKSHGYSTAFFHGAPNGSMGFDAFAKQVGFDAYFGKTEYDNDADYDGAWGIWDEEFLQFFAQKLEGLQRPFFGAVFTVTSHSPFKIPERYEGKFEKGPSRAHRVMAYTDFAVRRFFETAAKTSWYAETLFIITSDHGAARTHAEYKRGPGLFRVPMLFCNPGDPSLGGWDEAPIQHIDVMPTVLGYTGFRGDYVAFGTDALAPDAPRRAFHHHPDGTYELVEGEWAFQLAGDRPRAMYRYRVDRALERNELSAHPEVARDLEQKLRAIIQQYNNRLRDDRLVVR